MLLQDLGRIQTPVGTVAVCEVENPFEGQLPWARAYAAVVIEPSEAYAGPAVAMVVTVKDPDRPGTSRPTDPIGEWSGVDRMVDIVHRDASFRGGAGHTPAVLVGRFLFQQGAFTHHSVVRTDAGDRWARSVGGEVSGRREQEAPSLADAGDAALAKLNTGRWWSDLSGHR